MENQVLKTWVDERGILHSSIQTTALPADPVEQLRKDIEIARPLVKGAFEQGGSRGLRALIDLSNFDGTFFSGSFDLLAGYMKDNKPYIVKSAGFGANRTATLAANVVFAMGGRDNISFFATQDEALAWLLKD